MAPNAARTGEENGDGAGAVQATTKFDEGCRNGRVALTVNGESDPNMVEPENLNKCSFVK